MPDQPPSPDGPEDRAGETSREALDRLRRGGKGSVLGSGGRYAGLGLQFAVSILLFLYAGQWLDKRLGTSPLFLILGVFTGAGAAFYSIYKTAMADERDEAKRKAEQKSGRKPE